MSTVVWVGNIKSYMGSLGLCTFGSLFLTFLLLGVEKLIMCGKGGKSVKKRVPRFQTIVLDQIKSKQHKRVKYKKIPLCNPLFNTGKYTTDYDNLPERYMIKKTTQVEWKSPNNPR